MKTAILDAPGALRTTRNGSTRSPRAPARSWSPSSELEFAAPISTRTEDISRSSPILASWATSSAWRVEAAGDGVDDLAVGARCAVEPYPLVRGLWPVPPRPNELL